MELKPGYKQTEVGVIPEEWEVRNLGSMATYTNGKAHEGWVNDFGKYIVVNSKFISTDGEVRKYSDYNFCPASKGQILMVMSDVPNGRAIARCFWVESDNLYTVNQRICALQPLRVDGKFLSYKLNRNPFYLSFDDGAKQTNLRKDDVLACPLALPPTLAEQQAIAEALSDVDGLISALDALIAKKRAIKQGAMQELLTGQRRLPGFAGTWEVKKLGEIGTLRKGRNIPKKALTTAGLPCVLYGEIYTRYENTARELASFIPQEIAEQSTPINYGDILFAGSGETAEEIGKCFAYIGNDQAFAGGDLIILTPRECDSTFLGYLLNDPVVNKQKAMLGQGSSVVHIYTSSLETLELLLPPLAEQTAIAQILADMDGELAALVQKREKTQALKQGMMQALLTGQTRLV